MGTPEELVAGAEGARRSRDDPYAGRNTAEAVITDDNNLLFEGAAPRRVQRARGCTRLKCPATCRLRRGCTPPANPLAARMHILCRPPATPIALCSRSPGNLAARGALAEVGAELSPRLPGGEHRTVNTEGLVLRVRGDGHAYLLILATEEGHRYGARFPTREGYLSVRLPYAAFRSEYQVRRAALCSVALCCAASEC